MRICGRDSNILVTVGTRGTFQTLNQALEFMSKFMIIHHADGQQLKGRKLKYYQVLLLVKG